MRTFFHIRSCIARVVVSILLHPTKRSSVSSTSTLKVKLILGFCLNFLGCVFHVECVLSTKVECSNHDRQLRSCVCMAHKTQIKCVPCYNAVCSSLNVYTMLSSAPIFPLKCVGYFVAFYTGTEADMNLSPFMIYHWKDLFVHLTLTDRNLTRSEPYGVCTLMLCDY